MTENLSISKLFAFCKTNELAIEWISEKKHFDNGALNDLKSFIAYIEQYNPEALKVSRKASKLELQTLISDKYEALNIELERQNSELCSDITGVITSLKADIAILQNGIDGVTKVILTESRKKWSFNLFAKAVQNDAKAKKQAQKA